MSLLPAAIVFMNSDISDDQRVFMGKQLHVLETMSKAEFDARVAADPNYPAIIRSMKQRILVILTTFQDFVNRDLADVVLFLKGGLAYIEKQNNGPPKLAIDILRLDIYAILRYNKSSEVVVLPQGRSSCCGFQCSCSMNGCRCCHDTNCPSCRHGMGGIFAIQLRSRRCGIHAPSCDSLIHNENFKNRNY